MRESRMVSPFAVYARLILLHSLEDQESNYRETGDQEYGVGGKIMDYFVTIGSLVGLALLAGIAYYGIRLLLTFKAGLFEKGWRFLAIAGLFLTSAQIAFLYQGLFA